MGSASASSSAANRTGVLSTITMSALGASSGSGIFRRASLRPVARFMRTWRPGGMDWSSWIIWKCSVGWKIAG